MKKSEKNTYSDRLSNRIQKIMNADKKDKIRWILFGAALICIVFSRVYQIQSVPGDINQDEAFSGYNAYTLAHSGKDSFGYRFPMYLTAWGSGMNAMHAYLSIPFVVLFGTNAWSLRIVPVLCAVLTLLAVYFIAKHYVNEYFALFLFFFAGIAPWHIMLSRWGLESNLAPAFLCFGLFFFLKGIEQEKYFLWSVVFYGLSLYTYATIWVAVPFIIGAQVLYLILLKKIHFRVQTLLSAVILFVLALPALLFLLVNQGKIEEIRLPFLSIPKLVAFRGNEISLQHLPENFKNLWNIILTQNDGLPWNTTEQYGLFYKISLPFALIGLVYLVITMILKVRKKEFSIEIILFIHLLAGLMIGLLIQVNVNRVNILFLPLICLAASGLYAVFTALGYLKKWKKWKYYGLVIPVMVYLIFFIRFERFYFTEYKELIGWYFCQGLEEVMEYQVENLDETGHVYVTSNANYARILYYVRENIEDYQSSVVYTNYPSMFLDVASFGKYSFYVDGNREPDGTSVYILDESYQGSNLMNSLQASGYQVFSSGHYFLYYPQ